MGIELIVMYVYVGCCMIKECNVCGKGINVYCVDGKMGDWKYV